LKRAIQKLEDYWKSAEKAQTEGKYGYAESIWYAALEEAQELPRNDRRRALVMERLCECLWFQKKFDDAVPLAKELVGIYGEVLGHEHFDTACMVANLALLYHVLNDYNNAEPLLSRAHQIKLRELGAQHPEVVHLYNTLVEVRRALGLDKQEKSTVSSLISGRQWSKTGRFQAVKLPEAPTPPKMTEVDVSSSWKKHFDDAKFQADQCQWAKAEVELTQALSLIEQNSITDARRWTTLSALVDVLSKQDKHLQAANHAVRLHEILSLKEGGITQVTADSLNSLAKLYYYGGDIESALRYAAVCTKQYEHIFGAEDPSVATCLVNLGLLQHLGKHYLDAENSYKAALNIRTKKLGAEHPLTTQVLKNYANLLKETHRDEEAEHMQTCATGFVTGTWNVVELEERLTVESEPVI